MVESAGVYGLWFERQGVSFKGTEEIKPDSRRLAYQTECKRIFSGLWTMNYALGDKVGIRVNTHSLGNGLILRDTFEERDLTYRDKFVRKAFLVTKDAVFKVGPLTPKALEKTEKSEVNWRLSRLALVSDKIELEDMFFLNDPWDAERLDKVIRRSVESAKKKVGPQEYIANLARLN